MRGNPLQCSNSTDSDSCGEPVVLEEHYVWAAGLWISPANTINASDLPLVEVEELKKSAGQIQVSFLLFIQLFVMWHTAH